MAELRKEQLVYDQNVTEWRKNHLGECVLIKDSEVIGFFKSPSEAFDKGTGLFGLQPFFIREISPKDVVNVSFYGARNIPA